MLRREEREGGDERRERVRDGRRGRVGMRGERG